MSKSEGCITIQCYEEAVAIDRGNGEYYLWKAEIESRVGRKQEAIHSFQRAISLLSAEGNHLAKYAREKLREVI